jgi:hypothetical protein
VHGRARAAEHVPRLRRVARHLAVVKAIGGFDDKAVVFLERAQEIYTKAVAGLVLRDD